MTAASALLLADGVHIACQQGQTNVAAGYLVRQEGGDQVEELTQQHPRPHGQDSVPSHYDLYQGSHQTRLEIGAEHQGHVTLGKVGSTLAQLRQC